MIKGFITRQLALKVKWQAFNTVLEVELLLVGDCNVEWIITEQWSRSRGGRQGQREGEASGASVWAVRIFFRRRFRSDDGNSMGIQEQWELSAAARQGLEPEPIPPPARSRVAGALGQLQPQASCSSLGIKPRQGWISPSGVQARAVGRRRQPCMVTWILSQTEACVETGHKEYLFNFLCLLRWKPLQKTLLVLV